jgi:1-acyl-sn-glycerol-3-phosphate acyltransferase
VASAPPSAEAGPAAATDPTPRPRRGSAARTALAAVLIGPFTLLVAGAHLLLSLVGAQRSRAALVLERVFCAGLLAMGGVRVRVHGAEHLESGRGYVVMPNHRSWYDVPALHVALGLRDVRWVSKREVVPIPVFGWAYGLSRHVAIDRGDRESAVRAIRRAAEDGRGAASIVIFPEGTRSPDGGLLPFKKGGFHLALETGMPILPVAITGGETVLPKRSWVIRPGVIDVTFLPPVQPGGVTRGEVPVLVSRVRESIRAALPGTRPTTTIQESR